MKLRIKNTHYFYNSFFRGLVAISMLFLAAGIAFAELADHNKTKSVKAQAYALSPLKDKLYVGCNDAKIRIYNLSSGYLSDTIHVEEAKQCPGFSALTFSPDGRYFVIVCKYSPVILVDKNYGTRIKSNRLYSNDGQGIFAAYFSENSQRIHFVSRGNEALLISYTIAPKKIYNRNETEIDLYKFELQSKKINVIQEIRGKTGKLAEGFLKSHPLTDIGKTRIVSAIEKTFDDKNFLMIFQKSNDKKISQISINKSIPLCLALSPDEKNIAVAYEDSVILYSVLKNRLVKNKHLQITSTTALFYLSENRLCICTKSGKIFFYNPETGHYLSRRLSLF